MTPQQNHLAEIAFATISNRGRAMMYRANIPDKVKPKVSMPFKRQPSWTDLSSLHWMAKQRPATSIGVAKSQPLLITFARGVKLVL
jgi:hypothetical protein